MYDFLDYHVEDVMSAPAVTLEPSASLAEAEAFFEKHDFNGLPVVDPEGALVGFVTKLDLLRAFRFSDEHVFPPYEEIMKRPVSSVMTRDPVTTTPRAPLTRVLERMLQTRNKSLPVLDGETVVGVVAREDLLHGLRRAVDGERPWRHGGEPTPT
ncbi:MAG: CBS domain-containing protein [Myxococcota bacterium]